MEPFVSIVTPVYNGERDIEECIKSVLAQRYDNWEYIIVNNKSKDGTLAIAEKYAAIDSRITVVSNKELLPVMENFNNAIQKISPESKYCKILCADDWIYPQFLSLCVELAEQHPSVGIVSSYWLFGGKVLPEGMPYRETFFTGKNASRMNLLKIPYTFGTPSVLLYRSEVVLSQQKFYSEERTSGDAEACFEILKKWDFGFVPQVLSYQRSNDDTQTSAVQHRGEIFFDQLHMLKMYSEGILEEKEIQQEKKKLLDYYYEFIGTNPSKLKDKKLIDYHKDSLAKLGLKMEWYRIFSVFIFASIRYVFFKIPKRIFSGQS